MSAQNRGGIDYNYNHYMPGVEKVEVSRSVKLRVVRGTSSCVCICEEMLILKAIMQRVSRYT